MIAGELESSFNDSYNYFNFGKKKKNEIGRNNENRIPAKPKANIGSVLKKVGARIDEAGGLEGIGKTADSVRAMFRKEDPSAPPSDYQINLGNQESKAKEESEKKKDEEKKLIVTVAIVGGAVLLMGVFAWWYSNKTKLEKAP